MRAVIPTVGGAPEALRALCGLLGSAEVAVTVVHNGGELPSLPSGVEVVVPGFNIGYLASLRAAPAATDGWTILLNDDLELDPAWLRDLIGVLKQQEPADVIQVFVFGDFRPRVHRVPGPVSTFFRVAGIPPPRRRGVSEKVERLGLSPGDLSGRRLPDGVFASFEFVVIPDAHLERIAQSASHLPLYFEDVHVCRQREKLGIDVVVANGLGVHRRNASTRTSPATGLRLMALSASNYLHVDLGWSAGAARLLVRAALVTRALLDLVRGRGAASARVAFGRSASLDR